MLRNEWKFDYTASTLADAALAKRNAHEGKLHWWENKKAEVMTKVRESGIEVHESVAASYSNTKGSFGPQITIDATLQRDLQECQEKILSHTTLIQAYDGWVQVLTNNLEVRLTLHHDDWLFFFGK